MEIKYEKPTYDPFLVFKPSKKFVLDVIKQLKNQAYEILQTIERQEREHFPTEGFKKDHQKILSRIKQYTFRLGAYEFYKTWELPAEKQNAITEEHRQRAKAVQLTDLYAGKLRHHGAKAWGICPFHEEKTGSFCINLASNRFHCFGCGVDGDSIDFVCRTHGFELDGAGFIKAIKILLNMV